jgi:pSer/pThr/pTyr-binding forkhead associated (FHA) protein
VLELRPGVLLVGRSSGCHLILDDAMVSRRHAQLRVGAEVVTIEDYGSVNGVYVNARRVQGSEVLKEGDHLQIGTQEFVLHSTLLAEGSESGERFSADTVHGLPIPGELARGTTEAEATFSAHTLDLLGGVADKVLALGRGEEAEKMLATTLGNLLSEVRAGRKSTVNNDVLDKAAYYAVRLADATGKGKWVDYAVELFTFVGRPFPAPVVDRLYEAVRRTSAINLAALRAYLELLRRSQNSLGPAERFLLQRLEGLEPLVVLR